MCIRDSNPVVPFTRTPGRTGSVPSTWCSWSQPGLYQDTWQYPGRDQEYQVDGTDPVLPGVLVNGTTGLIPSPVCYGERDNGARYLVPSFLPGTWSRYGPRISGPEVTDGETPEILVNSNDQHLSDGFVETNILDMSRAFVVATT